MTDEAYAYLATGPTGDRDMAAAERNGKQTKQPTTLKPLTSLKREAEAVVGHSISASYRDIYTAAVDGVIPAEQVRGRWHYNPTNIRALASALMRI